MTGAPGLRGGSLASLALVSSRLHPNDIPAVVAEEAAHLGAGGLLIYLSDLEQRLLVPFQPPGAEPLEPLSIDGTVAGRAYRTQRRVLLETTTDAGAQGAGTTVWLPLLDSSARIGVISVCVDVGCGAGRGVPAPPGCQLD